MQLAQFTECALAYWNAIPAHFRQGVSALVIDPGSERNEEFDEGWIYGWCEPDDAVMSLPDAPVTSRITLFHGSFVLIAARDPMFDWEGELWETLRHELQHHLEWRAGDDDLGDEDDMQDENERRITGRSFQPDFHRLGVPLGEGAWLADGDLFLEIDVPLKSWPSLAEQPMTHRWGAVSATIDAIPQDLLDGSPIYADATFSHDDGDHVLCPWRDVVVVLRRTKSWWRW